jgi:hypothetical protein
VASSCAEVQCPPSAPGVTSRKWPRGTVTGGHAASLIGRGRRFETCTSETRKRFFCIRKLSLMARQIAVSHVGRALRSSHASYTKAGEAAKAHWAAPEIPPNSRTRGLRFKRRVRPSKLSHEWPRGHLLDTRCHSWDKWKMYTRTSLRGPSRRECVVYHHTRMRRDFARASEPQPEDAQANATCASSGDILTTGSPQALTC